MAIARRERPTPNGLGRSLGAVIVTSVVLICFLAWLIVDWTALSSAAAAVSRKYGQAKGGKAQIVSPKCNLGFNQGRQHLQLSTRSLVFGLASSGHNWPARRELVQLWWRSKLRGFAFTTQLPTEYDWKGPIEPQLRLYEDTSRFNYTNPGNFRDAIGITRIVKELYDMDIPDVEWFVLGDDDTLFCIENLLFLLQRYDSEELLYIGNFDEVVHANVREYWDMAFGGGGIVISRALARQLSVTLDGCLERYPELFGSDVRTHLCVAELGVQLTRERGFHQCDLSKNLAGLLEAHPLTPFISLHHLLTDSLEPLFPGMSKLEAIKDFTKPMLADPLWFLQQAVCVDELHDLTVSISWGYNIRVLPGVRRARELIRVPLTFLPKYYEQQGSDAGAFTFDAKPAEQDSQDICELPYTLFGSGITVLKSGKVQSMYIRNEKNELGHCPSVIGKIKHASVIRDAAVLPSAPQTPGVARGPNLRRLCCKSMQYIHDSKGRPLLQVHLGACGPGQTIIKPVS